MASPSPEQRDFITNVVRKFYDQAVVDIFIGYHFRKIADFEAHIQRISFFWQKQLFPTLDISYLKPPFDIMEAHAKLPIKRGEVGRWKVLFFQTLDEALLSSPSETQSQSQMIKEWKTLLETWSKRVEKTI